MKTMKCTLIGFFLVAGIQLTQAQAKVISPKPSVSSAATKTASQKASVKAVLPQVEIANQIAKGESEFSFLGTYSIYAGVQKIIIGKFTLRQDGTYTVVVNSDENSYSNGFYEYNLNSKTLVWKGGLFVSNKYNGVFQKMSNGKLRILFSKSTYAEKID